VNNAAALQQVIEAVAWIFVSGALLTIVVYLVCAAVGFLISGEEDV
jgi:hypothetical protein